jgi:hypothetical protein
VDALSLSSQTDQQVANLALVAWLFLIPLGLLLSLLLYKVVSLLGLVLEFGTIAKYELFPTLKHVHRIAGRVDTLSEKVSSGVTSVENTMSAVKPVFKKGAAGVKSVSGKVASQVTSRLGEAGKTLFVGLVDLINKRTRS